MIKHMQGQKKMQEDIKSMQKSENVNAWNSVNNVKKERAAAAADSGMHRRRDKHVEGVSFDTSIAKKSPEVRELPIDPKTAKDRRNRNLSYTVRILSRQIMEKKT